jgi:hypothetical protein
MLRAPIGEVAVVGVTEDQRLLHERLFHLIGRHPVARNVRQVLIIPDEAPYPGCRHESVSLRPFAGDMPRSSEETQG